MAGRSQVDPLYHPRTSTGDHKTERWIYLLIHPWHPARSGAHQSERTLHGH